MGTEPGKMSRQPDYAQGPRPDVSGSRGIPGKTTLAGTLEPTSAAAIGDPYIEGRSHCAAGTEGGCFLAPEQRGLLVAAYQQEVIVAQQQYSQALSEIKLERLIKKDEELPMLLGLMLDVLGTQLLSGLTMAFKMLQAGDEKTVVTGIEWLKQLQTTEHQEPRDKPSIRSFIQGVNETSVGFILKAGIDETKKSVKKPSPSNEKAQALSYIDRLQETAVIAWEHQRQDPPGYATDADMIVLYHSFKARMGHSTPRYKAALEEKIQRYLASPVSKIGRAKAYKGKDANVTDVGFGGMTTRDTKVVWVVTKGHALPQLYYYKLDASPNQNDHTMANLDVPMIEGYPAEGRFKINTPVEPEFVDTAISRHQEVWGSAPETKLVDPALVPHFRPARSVNDLNQYVPVNTPPKSEPKSEPKPIDVPPSLKLEPKQAPKQDPAPAPMDMDPVL